MGIYDYNMIKNRWVFSSGVTVYYKVKSSECSNAFHCKMGLLLICLAFVICIKQLGMFYPYQIYNLQILTFWDEENIFLNNFIAEPQNANLILYKYIYIIFHGLPPENWMKMGSKFIHKKVF